MKILIQFIERKLSRLILLGIALFFANNSIGQTVVLTNPASPWTVPAGVTSIKVEVWGGGGGGGGTLFTATGGGGGGGAYNSVTWNVNSSQSYTITIGSGGGSGNDGNPTTVIGPAGTISANPGKAGGGSLGGAGAAGAGGTGGLHSGGAGGSGSNGAGGGGGAGNNGDGVDGTNTARGTGGMGSPNTSPYIGGDGADPITSNGTGKNGAAPGGGGGGGKSSGLSSSNGGTGGAGQVVITYTPCPTINTTAAYNSPVCLGSAINLTASNASGGTSPYTYSWTGPLSYTSTLQNPVIPNSTTAMTGTYTVTAKDNNGCTGSSNVTVTVNPLPLSSVADQTNITCNGANDGSITVTASGGTGLISFQTITELISFLHRQTREQLRGHLRI